MDPFILLIALANADPNLELVFLPADAAVADRAGLDISAADDGSTVMGNFEIQRTGEDVARITVDEAYNGNFEMQRAPDSDEVLPRFEPTTAMPIGPLGITADAGWAVFDVRTIEAAPTPLPGPVLDAAAVRGMQPAAFVIDGVEVDGLVVLSDGRDAVGVLGLPVLQDGRTEVLVDAVHLVLEDADRY